MKKKQSDNDIIKSLLLKNKVPMATVVKVFDGLEEIHKKRREEMVLGRPKIEFPNLWDWYYPLWKKNDITAKECMESLGLKRTSFYKLVKQYEEMEQLMKGMI
ncbi:MAG: hypothetical protein ACRDA5_02310 [Clostridium sp.]